MLLTVDLSPIVRLNRAVVRHTDGPARALALVDELADPLGRHHLFHATRAALLRDLGRADQARQADEQVLKLTTNPAERFLLATRLHPTHDIH